MRREFTDSFEPKFHRELEAERTRRRVWGVVRGLLFWIPATITVLIPLLFIKKFQIWFMAHSVMFLVSVVMSNQGEEPVNVDLAIGEITQVSTVEGRLVIEYVFEHQGVTHAAIDDISERYKSRTPEDRAKMIDRHRNLKAGDALGVMVVRDDSTKNMPFYPAEPKIILWLFLIPAAVMGSVYATRVQTKRRERGKRFFVECLVHEEVPAPHLIWEELRLAGLVGKGDGAAVYGVPISPLVWCQVGKGKILKSQPDVVALPCPATLIHWIKAQPKPVDFDELLKRLDYAYEFLQGPMNNPHLNRERTIAFPVTNPWLEGLWEAGPAVENASVRLSLSGLDRRRSLGAYEGLMPKWPKQRERGGVVNGRKVVIVGGYSQCAEFDSHRHMVETVSASGEINESEVDSWTLIEMVNEILDLFDLPFWRWIPLQVTREMQNDDGEEATLVLSFTPGKELRIQRIG